MAAWDGGGGRPAPCRTEAMEDAARRCPRPDVRRDGEGSVVAAGHGSHGSLPSEQRWAEVGDDGLAEAEPVPVPVDREGRAAAVDPGWESDGAPPLRLQQGTRTMAVDAGTKRVSYGRETVDDARLAIDMDAVYERIRSRDVIMEDVVSGEEVVLEDRSLLPASHKSGGPNSLTINKDEL